MTAPNPSFMMRLALAFRVFWWTLTDPEFTVQITRLTPGELPAPTAVPDIKPVSLKEAAPDSALQLLGLLQQEGRFVDFLQEDVSRYSDAEIGAAARVVHNGCHKALREHLQFEPVRAEQEGAQVTLESGFDASAVRLTGNVVGKPPFRGTLLHRGWRVAEIKLPKLADSHDVTVVAPAEVEL